MDSNGLSDYGTDDAIRAGLKSGLVPIRIAVVDDHGKIDFPKSFTAFVKGAPGINEHVSLMDGTRCIVKDVRHEPALLPPNNFITMVIFVYVTPD